MCCVNGPGVPVSVPAAGRVLISRSSVSSHSTNYVPLLIVACWCSLCFLFFEEFLNFFSPLVQKLCFIIVFNVCIVRHRAPQFPRCLPTCGLFPCLRVSLAAFLSGLIVRSSSFSCSCPLCGRSSGSPHRPSAPGPVRLRPLCVVLIPVAGWSIGSWFVMSPWNSSLVSKFPVESLMPTQFSVVCRRPVAFLSGSF